MKLERIYTEDEVVVTAVPNNLQLSNALSEAAEQRWVTVQEKAKANGQEVWDAPMQRFENMREVDGWLHLGMSRIPFSTRFSLREMLIEGKTEVKSHGAYVHCLARTADDWYVFGKKSGKYVSDRTSSFIGGVLDYDGDRPRTPFEVARIELHEEAGVSQENIASLELVGMYESDNGSIGMTLNTPLLLDKAAMLEVFQQKTDNELAGLEFVRKDEVISHMRNVLQRGESEIAVVQQYLEREEA